MNQTSVIVAALVVAFLVFITVRGELPCYFQALGISSTGNNSATGAGCPKGQGGSVSSATGVLGAITSIFGDIGSLFSAS